MALTKTVGAIHYSHPQSLAFKNILNWTQRPESRFIELEQTILFF